MKKEIGKQDSAFLNKEELEALRIFLGLEELDLIGITKKTELREYAKEWVHQRKAGFEDYLRIFCPGGFEREYKIQKSPRSEWRTVNATPSTKIILDHLRGKYSIALRAGYYPSFAIIDIDRVSTPQKEAEKWAEMLNLHESQFFFFTSPSYFIPERKHNGGHLLFKPRYKGKPATRRLFQTILGATVDEGGAELFPQAGNAIRLPFGESQLLVDSNGIRWDLSWYDLMQEFHKLNPVALDKLCFPCRYSEEEKYLDNLPKVPYSFREAEEILANGFKERTRHISTGVLARHYFRLNYEREEAKEEIELSMRKVHKGRSKEINAGNWDFVNGDIDRFVDDTYDFFENKGIYPDSVHNMESWVTKQDIELGAAIFPASYINQKRFFKLSSYYRPRSHMIYVPVHSWTWRKFANSRDVQVFIDFLSGKDMLDINRHYDKIKGYPRRYRLTLPSADRSEMLKDTQGRAIHDYKKALKAVYGSVSNIVTATGISRHTLYEK